LSVLGKDLTALVEEFAPVDLAEPWDRVGWQLGDPGLPVDGVLLTLDPGAEALEEARAKGAGLVVAHHPLFLEPLPHLRLDGARGRLVAAFLKHGVGLYVAHTNLDRARGGVSAVLAQKLGLGELRALGNGGGEEYLKLAVFVPETHLDQVREALGRAGAGQVGNYDLCSFAVRGLGTFRPGPGTNPFIGRTGELSRVEEARLETIVPARRLQEVLAAMLAAHPYEEVAYDLYAMENRFAPLGLLCLGSLPEPRTLEQLGALVKVVLGASRVRLGGPPEKMLVRVATAGGSGSPLWREAYGAGAQVLVTGEVKYHDGRDMLDEGLCFVEAGHAATERVILPVLGAYLQACCRERSWPVVIYTAQRVDEPFWYL